MGAASGLYRRQSAGQKQPSPKKPKPTDAQLGPLARAEGVSEDDLARCRAMQKKLARDGRTASLFKVAKAMGVLSPAQAERIRERLVASSADTSEVRRPRAQTRRRRAAERGPRAKREPTDRVRRTGRKGGDLAARRRGIAATRRRTSAVPMIVAGVAGVLTLTGVALAVVFSGDPAADVAAASTSPAAPDAVEPAAEARPEQPGAAVADDLVDGWLEDEPADAPAEDAPAEAGPAASDVAAAPAPTRSPAPSTKAAGEDDAPAPATDRPGKKPAPTQGPQGPSVEPAPAPADPEPAASDPEDDATRTADLSDALGALALLDEVFAAYDEEDAARLGEATTAVADGLGEEAPEAYAARGLACHLDKDWEGTIRELEQAEGVDDWRIRRALAHAAFVTGRYDKAGELIADADPENPFDLPEAELLTTLIEGPFRRDYPHAAPALERVTDEGHYRVITDMGLSLDELDDLEARLAAADEAERTTLIERARKRHRGLHELAGTMDKAYDAYAKLFGQLERSGDVVPTVYVFSDRSKFDAFSRRLNVGSTENTLGYYMPAYRILVFYDMAEGGRANSKSLFSAETMNVLLHETFHQWIHLYVDDAPHWFNEGLAEYFGISRLTPKGLHYGLVPTSHPSRLSNIRQSLRGGYGRDPLSLRELITASPEQFMSGMAAINYAQAWSFVHYLGSSKGGEQILRDYFHALRDGADRQEAYRAAFGDVDMDALHDGWRAYVFALGNR